MNKTTGGNIDWVSCEALMEHLEIEGISIDGIKWLHRYLKHLQTVRHIPILSKTYVTFYKERIFAISQSKYSRDIRIDFTSSSNIDGMGRMWRGIIESQILLMRLHSAVELVSG